MSTCKDCLHYEVCGGFTPTDLDADVFDYCRKGNTDEIPDIDERCGVMCETCRYYDTDRQDQPCCSCVDGCNYEECEVTE